MQSSQPENMTDQDTVRWNHSLNENDHLSYQEERSWRNWARIVTITVAATAVIVGGAVGGGLGASLANCRQNLGASLSSCENDLSQCENAPLTATKDPPFATTSSAAFETTTGGLLVNYTIEPPSKVFNVSVDCDALAASIQVTQAQEKFLVYCGVDFGTGDRINRDGDDVVLADIARFTSYSMQDCLEACSQYTYKSQLWGVNNACGSVNFQVLIAKNPTGNCWLKNSTITHSPGAGQCDYCIGATKIS
ncbi:hypothetical protein E0Z10_g3013 [Xylaria hypoxylon]|uniref:Apple domain-containing protein n=1 Tax=Xylaria hypoxylon TaxID=37992 RepID=A0A4Z0Z4S0_9PEZI|nr:hypothetical protein E0Z10_g3013 [Xylaria hypoxylon]